MSARPLPLLICSIGNPGSQYANTLHSAGHIMLRQLAKRLGCTEFTKDRALGKGLVTKPFLSDSDWTLWQSTSYMNESGKGVKDAFTSWSKPLPHQQYRLVVVHDELEKPLGAVTLKTNPTASAKGHNGLKSIMSVMAGGTPWVRIGIGIGRPASREKDDVANFVLKKATPAELAAMDLAVEGLVARLHEIESGA